MYVTSSMQGQTPKKTQVIILPHGIVGFPFQSDDGFVLLAVGWKCVAYISYGMIDDAVDEEVDIRHEFTYPRRIRSLIDSPL